MQARKPAPPTEVGPSEAGTDPGWKNRRASGKQDLLCGPENSRLGAHTAWGGRLLVLEPKEPGNLRKEVKTRVVGAEKRSEDVVEGSGYRCKGGPAKPLHCSWDWGACALLKSPCFPRSSSPFPSHRGHLSYPWAVLGLMLEGPRAGGREETMLGPAFFLLVATPPTSTHPNPRGRGVHSRVRIFPGSLVGAQTRERTVSPPAHTDASPCSLGSSGGSGWCRTGLSRPLAQGEDDQSSSPTVLATFSELCFQ